MTQRTQVVGYVRASSIVQNPARQLEAIGHVDRVVAEKLSGGTRQDRAALEERIRRVRDTDLVFVASMGRLARSLRELRSIIDEPLANGATVEFIKEGQTYSLGHFNALANLLLNMLGSFADFERELIRERQAEGTQLAKHAGRSRKPAQLQLDEIRKLLGTGVSKAEIARLFNVDRSIIYHVLAATES